MRPLLALPLVFLSAQAAAFPFGRDRAENAEVILASMRASFAGGDCVAVGLKALELLDEKPPAALREEAYSFMGRCHEISGAADKAIAVYTLALGLFPENAGFARRLGSIYVAAGFHAGAVPLFEKVLAARPDDVAANLGLGRAYAAQGFLARAKERYSVAVILQEFRDQAVLEEYARWMLRKRDWEEAVYIADKGAAAAPTSHFWKQAAARAAAGRNDLAGAIAAMDEAIKINDLRELRLERATFLLLGGKTNEALAAAERELASDPEDRTAALLKGMALFSQGHKKESVRFFSAAACGRDLAAGLAGAFLKGEVTPACKN